MEASHVRPDRNPFSDPVRLWGMALLSAVAAGVFVPAMVAPWQAGGLTPELMRTLLGQGAMSQPALFALPLALGALVLILRPSPLTRSLDDFSFVLERWREQGGSGKFARFFVRPFVAISGAIWDKTADLAHPDWRSAVRVTLQCYLIGLFLFLAFTAAMILIVLVAIGIGFAIVSAFMGGSAGSSVTSHPGAVVRSRRTKDWVGDKVEHFNESGEKVAESRRQRDWVGEKVTHTNASGEVIGESREHTDWIGKKTDHYSVDGEHVGESRAHTDFLGDKVDHYSTSGAHVGESRRHSDFVGDHVAHEGESPVDRIARRERGAGDSDASES